MESQSAVLAVRSKTWEKIKDPPLKTESTGNFVGSGAPCHTEANLRDSEMCKKMTSCPNVEKHIGEKRWSDEQI